MSKSKVKVTISGSAYFLITDQSEEHIQEAASYVNSLIQGSNLSIEDYSKILVLTALQLASNLLILQEQQKHTSDEQERLMAKLNSVM